MWAEVRKYVVAAIVITAAWLGGVLALNATVFSPSGVVIGYLDALERGDIGEALAIVGAVEPPPVLPDLDRTVTDQTVVSTLAIDDVTVVVSVRYVLDGIPSESLFTVTRTPRTLGLFDRWEFQAVPTTPLRVTIDGASAVTINDATFAESETSSGLSLLYPGRYTISWSSGWVETDTTDLVIDNDQALTVRLVAAPTDELRNQVTDAVGSYLTGCTDQAVLQPAGCPFGVSLTDRVVGDVSWEVTTDPVIDLRIADDEETVIVSALGAEATLTVSLQSLFDGSIQEFVESQTVDVTGVVLGLGDNAPQFIVD